MRGFKIIRSLLFLPSAILLFASCSQQFKRDNFKAYFGGEVLNPVNRYVLFCKGADIIDTIPLNKNNTFFKAFDSLPPGLYSFRHDPEYQYVYFDKNDSLMVQLNAKDFDRSIVFCGRGDQKNNFLMDVFLKNEADKNEMYTVFDYDVPKFVKTIEASHDKMQDFYESQKEDMEWSDGFDAYARAAIDFHQYSKKELYPLVHRMRTGEELSSRLPADFYQFRQKINYNDAALADFAPFVAYLSHMLNNIAAVDGTLSTDPDMALRTNIHKMQIADTLFTDSKIKNVILNNIAFAYLLEDQNMANNQEFLQTFHKYSTDKNLKSEITKIGNAIQQLDRGMDLPAINLVTTNGKIVSSQSIPRKKTVLFCWTDRLNSHFIASHKKVLELSKKYPDYQFVSLNLDSNHQKWTANLARYNFPGIIEFRAENFEEVKEKWAITKIHRTIILNADGTINDAFANLFDANFELSLTSPQPNPISKAFTSR